MPVFLDDTAPFCKTALTKALDWTQFMLVVVTRLRGQSPFVMESLQMALLFHESKLLQIFRWALLIALWRAWCALLQRCHCLLAQRSCWVEASLDCQLAPNCHMRDTLQHTLSSSNLGTKTTMQIAFKQLSRHAEPPNSSLFSHDNATCVHHWWFTPNITSTSVLKYCSSREDIKCQM